VEVEEELANFEYSVGSDPEIGTLLPGESITLEGTYKITQDDVNEGSVYNKAIAKSEQTDPKEDDEEVPLGQNPSLTISKVATNKEEELGVGDFINYEIVVTNTGNVTLTGVEVEEELANFEYSVGSDPEIGTLLPGESITLEGTYKITQDDVNEGSVYNKAIAKSEQTDPKEDDEEVPLGNAPDISLTKEADKTLFGAVGDVITYTFTVTNTGNVTLTDVSVYDDTLEVLIDLEDDELEPGQSTKGTYKYTITEEDVEAGKVYNAATASGYPPESENPITDEDDETVGNWAGRLIVRKIVRSEEDIEDEDDSPEYVYGVSPGGITVSSDYNELVSGTSISVKPTATSENLSAKGFVFDLYRDGKLVGTATTDEDGIAVFDDLIEGWYELVERPRSGYQQEEGDGEFYFSEDTTDDGIFEITVVNIKTKDKEPDPDPTPERPRRPRRPRPERPDPKPDEVEEVEEEEVPEAPVIPEPQPEVVIPEEPIPEAPVLPKTGSVDINGWYGIALLGLGALLRRRKK
ncbi:MAG: SpaA isopeptide-forming pilin-related protein, partial [Gudongella sp.]|nr:SpaA isopeptide-forming pilin-related protein [Gudongella sp.]